MNRDLAILARGDRPEFEHSLVEAIYEASPDGILVVDEHAVVVSRNQRFLDVWHIEPEALVGGGERSLTGSGDEKVLEQALGLVAEPDVFMQRVQELYADPVLEDVCFIDLTDGRTLERHSRALWASDGAYLGRVWFFRDITAHKQTEQALKAMSLRDELTGVANRRSFFERGATEFARARRSGQALSLVMVDIDHFKQVNDRWGHAAGDAVLMNLCACAQAELREVDLFARFGGEEFAALLPDTTLAGATVLAERLRARVAAQVTTWEGEAIRYTLSAGVATLGSHDASVETLLRRADDALYAAKRAGRDRVMRQAPD